MKKREGLFPKQQQMPDPMPYTTHFLPEKSDKKDDSECQETYDCKKNHSTFGTSCCKQRRPVIVIHHNLAS